MGSSTLAHAGESPRAVDLALAATLAFLPLLPTGPQYLGASAASWSEAVLIPLVALVLVTRGGRRGAEPAGREMVPSAVAVFMLPFLAAVTGAALLGLASDNVLISSGFLLNLRDVAPRLFAPMDAVADPLYALRVWLTFVEGPAALLLVLAICRRAPNPRARARWALGGATIGLTVVSGFAVFQYMTRFHLHPYWVRANPNLVRSHSTFEDPNTLGSYLVLGIGIAIGLALHAPKGDAGRWRLWLAVGASVLGVLALGTTVSRAAWGATVLAALALTAFGVPSTRSSAAGALLLARRAARAGLVVLSLIAIIWLVARLWLPDREGYRPTNPVDAVRATVDPTVPVVDVLKGRSLYWAAALQLAHAHPVAGVGLGRFPRQLRTELAFPHTIDNAHNLPLQLLAETGAVGFLTALAALVAAASALRAALKGHGPDARLAWGLSLGCLAFLLTLSTGHPLLLPSVQLVVGTSLAAGLCATFPSETLAEARRRAPHVTAARAVSASLAVAVVYGGFLTMTTCPCSREPFGYAWGLYDPETDHEGRTFRWMGRAAVLHLTPPAGASELTLEFAAFAPPADSPATVTLNVAGRQFLVTCPDGSWRQVKVPLDPAFSDRGIDIRVDVDRTVVPASLGGSDDVRRLGVALRPPGFARASDRGAHHAPLRDRTAGIVRARMARSSATLFRSMYSMSSRT